MKKLLSKKLLLGLVLLALVTSGCLVSATFVVVYDIDFSFTADHGFYWYPVDLTDNSDWENHQDDIDDIDAIGFEFNIENTSGSDCSFNVWFAPATGEADLNDPPTTFDPVALGAVHVITDLSVAAGAIRTVSYAESLGHISSFEAFKAIVKSGRFDYYGTSCGGTDDDEFIVTDGSIIVTVSASGSGS